MSKDGKGMAAHGGRTAAGSGFLAHAEYRIVFNIIYIIGLSDD